MAHSAIRIRPATPEDATAIIGFVRGLALYEREPLEHVKLTEEDIRRDGFGPTPRFEALMAELDGTTVGYALFVPNYSTWEGRPGLFVEDLFVEERARGKGLGRALLSAIARTARERGYPRVDLNVMHWNPTREFYHRLGFRHIDEWLPYRLDEPALGALAREAPPLRRRAQ